MKRILKSRLPGCLTGLACLASLSMTVPLPVHAEDSDAAVIWREKLAALRQTGVPLAPELRALPDSPETLSTEARQKAEAAMLAQHLNHLRQVLLGDGSFAVWDSGAWAPLTLWQTPEVRAPKLDGVVLSGEFLEFGFAVTNPGDREIVIDVAVDAPGFTVIPRISAWVTGVRDTEDKWLPETRYVSVDDPLLLLENDRSFRLAPGETRRLYLCLDSRGTEPGVHPVSVTLTASDGAQAQVDGSVQVSPVKRNAPDDMIVFTFESLHRSCTSAHIDEAVRDLELHGQNVYHLNYEILPQFDPATRSVDCSRIVEYLKKLPKDMKMLLVYWGVEPGNRFFCNSKIWGTPDWRENMRITVEAWYRAFAEAGLRKDQIIMYPIDEVHDKLLFDEKIPAYQALYEVLAELKSIDPEIVTFVNPVPVRRDRDLPALRKMAPLVDIWAPKRDVYLPGETGWPYPYGEEDKAAGREFFESERARGKPLWAYQCDGPAKRLPPLAYYRSFGWQAWQNHITGLAVWNYNDTSDGRSWSDLKGGDYTMIYERKYAPEQLHADPRENLIPARRWFAWRQMVQDFTLLHMAEAQFGRDAILPIVEQLLQNPAELQSYEDARRELIRRLEDARNQTQKP